jgi:cytohesin
MSRIEREIANALRSLVLIAFCSFATVLSSCDNQPNSPSLSDAIAADDYADVKRHLQNQTITDFDAVNNDSGETPLTLAARDGQYETVKLLLEEGANVDARNLDGDTPLVLASAIGHIEVVQLLLENNADPRAKDGDGLLPNAALFAAMEYGNVEIAEMLLALHTDYSKKQKEILIEGTYRKSLANLVDILRQPEVYSVPLEQLLTPDTGKKLLEYIGMLEDSIALRDKYDGAELSCESAISILLDSDGQIDASDDQGMTPLHHAAQGRAWGLAELLLDRGANPNVVDDYGSTPLHLATGDGVEVMIVEMLLEHNADVNARNELGETPLLYLVAQGFLADEKDAESVIEELLTGGANPNAVNNDGASPLHLASWFYGSKIGELLIKHGAELNVRDNDGKTPLDYALEEDNQALVGTLSSVGAIRGRVGASQ